MTELNQKFTESMPRRHSLWGVYMREKYLYEKLAVKEERIYPLEGKGAYFRELTVYSRDSCTKRRYV